MSGKGDCDLDEGENEVTCRFVIPAGRSEATVTEDLARAFERCQEAGLGPQWVQEQEVLNISPTKTVQFIHGELDVFVMDPFSGPAFSHITSSSKFKCTVVGPRCLLHCLDRDMAIPEMPYPLYTAAMYGLTVTMSDMEAKEKERLKGLIQRMSGVVSKTFHEGVTHLVAGSVGSKKYQAAATREVPVMLPGWVDEVFLVSSRESVSGTDPRFSSLRCPVMQGMVVSVSQMARKDKDLMKKMVENHGGQYMPTLEQDVTKVLVCATPSGDKYNYAKKWKLPCVTSEWVSACIDKGYCLSFSDYRVDRQRAGNASTPTKDERTLAEVSLCSTILNPDDTMATRSVEDTVNSTALEAGLSLAMKGKTTANWLEELELGKVKKAGNFLDGCKIYLSGFTEAETVQLARVLKFGGGVRLTQLVESVTHVVHSVTPSMVGETARLLTQLDLTPHHVALEWMVESMRRGRTVTESDYPFPPVADTQAMGAPLLPPPSPSRHDESETQFEAHLLAQYGGGQMQASTTGNSTAMTDTASMSQVAPFLQGLRLELVGFEEEVQQDLTEWVTEAGGELVYLDYSGVLDYVVVPISGGTSRHKTKHMVNSFWLEDCLDASELLPVAYNHHPLQVDREAAPLSGVVTCLSGYNGKEREYLSHLVGALGGCAQDMLAKRANKAKGAKESTHLICPEATGDKYSAAVKWGRPVVGKDWLLACLKEMLWLSEQPFLIGNSSAVTDGKPMPRVEEPADDTVVEEDIDKNEDQTMEEPAGNTKDETMEEDAETTETDQTMEVGGDDHLWSRRKSVEISFPGIKESANDLSVADNVAETKTPVTTVKMRVANSDKLDTSGQGVDTPTLERLRPKPINLNDISVTPQRWADSQPSPSQAVPAKRKRDEARDSLDAMDTPETPYGAHWTGPNPSPRTRKYYKREGDNMPRFKLTDLQRRQKEQFETESKGREDKLSSQQQEAEKKESEEKKRERELIERNKRQQEQILDEVQKRGVPVLERTTRTFEQIMEERYKNVGRGKDPLEDVGGVLAGVVVFVSKKLSGKTKEIHEVVESLGGSISWQQGEEVTHFLFQGRQHDLSKEFRLARERGCEVVAPDWVFKCEEEGERLPESSYPHTYNPRRKLNISGTPTSTTTLRMSQIQLSQSLSSSPKDVSGRLPQPDLYSSEPMETETSLSTPKAPNSKSPPPTDTMQVSTDLANIENLLSSVSNTPVTSGSSRKVVRTVLTTQEKVRAGGELQEKEKEIEVEEPSKESQVLWCDPQEEVARKTLAAELNALETQDLSMGMETMGSMNIPDNLTAMMDQTADKENEKQEKVIIVSGWSDSDTSLQETVSKLGLSRISQTSHYDPDTTHMVATKVSRSEKMLCSMAAGKWVLHPSFVSASLTAGKWLPEERFEWGNPASKFLPVKTSDSLEAKLASAARRWRQRGGAGAFQGMKVVLHTPDNKQASFTRLVTAGGGEVMKAKPPYTYQKTEGVTHLLTESRYVAKGQVDFNEMASRGIPVLKLTYLNEFLTSEQQPPNLEPQLLEEFKTVWEEQSKKRSRVTTDTPTSSTKKTKSFTADNGGVNLSKKGKTVLGKIK